MHKIIIRDKYLYHQILEEFSRRLVTIVDLNRLLYMLGETISKSMGVTKQIIQKCKKINPKAVIVVGGAHPSAVPEQFEDIAHFSCHLYFCINLL
jgi:hypothetical protein